jgi:hypothetical protein
VWTGRLKKATTKVARPMLNKPKIAILRMFIVKSRSFPLRAFSPKKGRVSVRTRTGGKKTNETPRSPQGFRDFVSA